MQTFKTEALLWLWLFSMLYGFIFLLKWLIDWDKQHIAQAFGVKAQLYFGFLGIWIHELSHALFAVLFRHHIIDMKLMEYQQTGQNVRLGHVDHSFNKRSVYQVIGNFFIGIGPLIGCSAFLIGLCRWLVPQSFIDFKNVLNNLLAQANSTLFLQQLQQALGNIIWRWPTFLFLGLLILTIIGYGLSMADIKNSLTGLPYILILCILLSIVMWFLKFDLILALTRFNLVLSLILSIIMVVSILYSIFIRLLCYFF